MEADTQLYEYINSEHLNTSQLVVQNKQSSSIKTIVEPIHILQPVAEDKQNDSIETTIGQTFVNSKINGQVPDSSSATEIEPYFDGRSSKGNSTEEKSSRKEF